MEQNLVPSLIAYCQHCFADTYLPSHDTSHHLRTWKFARMLVSTFSATREYTRQKLDNFAFACLLHDTGMSVTIDPEHGPAGRKLAEQFISAHNLSTEYFNEALDAIAFHDDKDYRDAGNNDSPDPQSVIRILSLADDMDALGYIGVFRYYEIYVLRGFTTDNLAKAVLGNLEKRFSRMERLLADFPEWLDTLREKFNVIHGFFTRLAGTGLTEISEECSSGPRQVLCIFDRQIRIPHYSPEEYREKIDYSGMGDYAMAFFKNFYLELES
ncbi:MAG: HD domain-containing protein [Chlorobi bacterium]|nr:HD domain-containing protein [Chlorobiota bacterium]